METKKTSNIYKSYKIYIHTHIIMHMFIHTVHDTSAVTM